MVLLFFFSFRIEAEPLRVIIQGNLLVSLENTAKLSLPLTYNSSALVSLGEDTRFFKGVELELGAPSAWLSYQGSLAIAMYANPDHIPEAGIADLDAKRIVFEPLPAKIQSVYQIPLRRNHDLRNSPYVSVPTGVIPVTSFPLLIRLMPVLKGMNEELETMNFQLSAKPILGDEGILALSFRWPEQLPGKPFTALIDDVMIENPGESRFLKEGEHHLVILSDDYRNENRRFIIERAKVLELSIELKDPTPVIYFEAPENARIFLNNEPVLNKTAPCLVEPGTHEVQFHIGDYGIFKTLQVQKGKTYKVSMEVDVSVNEE
ncbi:MAG: hypothetical protein LBE10_08745 [Treponema sp.]|jgi:hypothetical protein|nr:hypothetical protein [Treponema sp.]